MVFVKGNKWNGNTNGRPPSKFRKKLEEWADKTKALDKALDVMEDTMQSSTKFDAAKFIIEQLAGKAPQTIIADVLSKQVILIDE